MRSREMNVTVDATLILFSRQIVHIHISEYRCFEDVGPMHREYGHPGDIF